MLQSLSESLFGNNNGAASPAKSPRGESSIANTSNVNTNPRGVKKPASKNKVAESPESALIESLKNELRIKDAALAALSAKVDHLEDEKRVQDLEGMVKRRHRAVATVSHLIDDTGRHKVKMGTRGSILTQNILQAMSEPKRNPHQQIAEKFISMFQDPIKYIQYLQSETFAQELIQITRAVSEVFEAQPRCVFLQSPAYVFGDIHGNLEDLHFFSDNLWKLGMDLAAGHFLFLGDYVDRGMSCLEVVAYLFALKVLYPHKITMLRGNHETRDVNGWEQHYLEKSFLYQCKDRFGLTLGETLWEECNLAFDRLPLAAVIDHEIFCIHGGIPRPVKEQHETEIQAILAMPNVISIMPAYDHEQEWMKQVGTDCIWSDPASEEMESMLDETGFGESPRGGGAVCFGNSAIENFLTANNLSYIIRAHEAHAYGVSLSKGARVFTVFSTSKDHRQGDKAMAGCILVDNEKIQVINRSPKYKNKYVHRRTSQTLATLTPKELEERRRLGLVRFSIAMEDMSRLINIRNAHGGTTSASHSDNGEEDDEDDEDEDGEGSGRRGSETLRPGF